MNRIALLAFLLTAPVLLAQSTPAPRQPDLGHRSAPVITVDGLQFKDLNRNGKLDPYEDWRLAAAERARDLVSRMTLEEMAGLMVHGTLPTVTGTSGSNAPGAGTAGYDLTRATPLLTKALVSSFMTRLSGAPAFLATENNRIQVGYGAQKDGWDSHNYYGRFATFPGNNFEYHITPYLGAFEAQVGGIMPVYTINSTT